MPHLEGDVLHLQIAAVRKLPGGGGEDVGDRVAERSRPVPRWRRTNIELFTAATRAGGHGVRLQVVRAKAVALVLDQNLRHDAMESGFRHAVREGPTAFTDAGRRLGIKPRAARTLPTTPPPRSTMWPDDRLHQQQLRRDVAVEPLFDLVGRCLEVQPPPAGPTLDRVVPQHVDVASASSAEGPHATLAAVEKIDGKRERALRVPRSAALVASSEPLTNFNSGRASACGTARGIAFVLRASRERHVEPAAAAGPTQPACRYRASLR